MTSRLTIHGAARTVTGSCFLIEHEDRRLLVDCGLFQGSKSLRELNYRSLPFAPEAIDAVLVTHAHIDHSGLLPKLVSSGYRGRILATAGTRDLLTYMLPDCGAIQEAEVERLNRRRQQRGERPVEPIYTKARAEEMLAQIDAVDVGSWFAPIPGFRARLWNAGHILGAASIELELAGGTRPLRLLFSGDIGGPRALHPAAEAPSNIDYLLVEATYGSRSRVKLTPEQRREVLAAEVSTALAAGGNLVIPAFAVERTQELLFDLSMLFHSHRLPEVPVFLDSPLAVRATETFIRHAEELGEAATLNHPFGGRNFRMIEAVEESKMLNHVRSGAIILAASGMCDAGRIRHHLVRNLWREEATILFVGYQAPGTLGHLLLAGAKAVRILGEEVKVRARLRQIDAYSAHADRDELLGWVMARQPVHCAILLTHGEPESLASFGDALRAVLTDGPPVLAPAMDDALTLDGKAPRLEHGISRLPTEAAGRHDWHNEYAALLLDISERLRNAPDEATRRRLLEKLKAALA
jgi:metallo-beta-lactamase family protein